MNLDMNDPNSPSRPTEEQLSGGLASKTSPKAQSSQVVTLSELEMKVLSWWSDMDAYYATNYTGLINHTGLNKDTLKPIIVDLKSKGYLVYAKGLMNEDGEMGGSGWSLTESGQDVYYDEMVKDLVATHKEATDD